MSPRDRSPLLRLELPGSWRGRDWLALLAVVAAAAVLRLAFFAGFFGSDDVNSSTAALALARGEWATSSTYLASLRLGISIPAALFIRIFGFSELSASLWALAASLGEVALVFGIGRAAWGIAAGVLAGLVIALTPIHVLHGGLPTGDAPLALFVTLSLALFLVAESRRRSLWYALTGLAVGATFWVKESAIVWTAAFAAYAIGLRRWDRRWVWVAAGALAMVLANMAAFLAMTGDALYFLKIIVGRRALHERVIASGYGQPPWFYFRYLFADVRHTWLFAYLAVGGLILWARRRRAPERATATTAIVAWGAGLFLVLNFLPIKLQPLTFIFKQTNYMLVFWAPVALLAGYGLAALRPLPLAAALVVVVPGSLVLSALEQQAIRVFTANSRAIWEFAVRHPDAAIYATEHATNMATVLTLADGTRRPPVRSLRELAPATGDARHGPAPRFAVLDLETARWGDDPLQAVDQVPPCWERVVQLRPTGFGTGAVVTAALERAARQAPDGFAAIVRGRLRPLVAPRPAFVYAVPPGCAMEARR
jgi:hypothetical protein